MANSYYTFPTPFVPGTKVRSDEVNVQFATLESAFDLLPTSPTAPARGVTFTGTESGSGNSYAVAMPNTRLSNQAGDRCIFRATHANTATITLNIDGLGPLTVVRADGTPVVAGDIVSGLYYEVVYDLVLNRYQLQVPTSVYLSDLDDRIDWATEWAVNAEDSAVSVAAGGDGSTTFSSLHWAAKSAASAASVSGEAAAAAASAAAALVSENNAAASESAADIDAIATAADRVQTGLDAVATAADRVQTGLDAVATASDAVDTAADLTQTDLDQISCSADAAAALASANSAAASYDAFDDRYLGSKASDPTLDNDSNALLEGALYWNSTNKTMRIYTGTVWQDVGASTANVTTYTATAGQTTFSGADDNALVLSYTVGFIQVYLNGVLLENTTDYTATSGTSIVLTAGALAGDVLQGFGFGTFDIANHYTKTEIDANTYTQTAADAAFAPITRSRKNMVYNGNFNVWQRGTPLASVSGWTADRWNWSKSTTAVVDISQTVAASADKPFPQHLIINVQTADTIATAEYGVLLQKLEGYDWSQLLYGLSTAKTITLSFYHSHTVTGTYCVALRNAANDRSYVAEYTQTTSNTWEKATITIPGCTDGTWVVDNTLAATLMFTIAAGATYDTTADAWQAGNYFSTTNQVNGLSSASNFSKFGHVQLEVGEEATDFEFRTISEELELCKRYFERITPGVAFGQLAGGYASNTTNAIGDLFFAEKIGTPTITAKATTALAVGHSGTHTQSTAVGVALQSKTSCRLSVTVASGLTAWRPCSIEANGATDWIQIDAEL